MSIQSKQALIVMAKAPVPGKVKTRLCPPLSPEIAAELYRWFLIDIFQRVASLQEIIKVIAYAPVGTEVLFRDLLPPGKFLLIPQRGQDLGERMANLFEDLFRFGCDRVSLIGSDLPNLPLEFLRESLEQLKKPDVDVVLGPSEDGGYYLVGLRKLHAEIFRGVTWSTNTVLAETLARIHQLGLKEVLLSAWYDVDTLLDLRRLLEAGQPQGGAPLATLEFLKKLQL
jgi:hypothetical protein